MQYLSAILMTANSDEFVAGLTESDQHAVVPQVRDFPVLSSSVEEDPRSWHLAGDCLKAARASVALLT